jgi:hypothetical protein
MSAQDEMISRRQAADEVALATRRLALLHLAFAETLVDELGETRGRELVVRAIRNYGHKIAKKARQAALEQGLPLMPEHYDAGGPNWPSIGTCDAVESVEVEGERRTRVHGCALAKVWREYGGEALGRLYCLIDVAKMMAYNPAFKVTHISAEPDGDDYCELVLRKTTAQEREDFAGNRDFSYADEESHPE